MVLGTGTAHAQGSNETLGFVLKAEHAEKAEALLGEVFTPFLGEWVGTRESKDTGAPGAVVFRKRYSLLAGGPNVIANVEALVDGVQVFAAAKTYAYSPDKDTLLTYFFEGGGNVQIFELDRTKMKDGSLIWHEISRKGLMFRAEETIPKNGEFKSTILQQNAAGTYEVFARNILRRAWKEANNRRK
jgi:hypothetical protein